MRTTILLPLFLSFLLSQLTSYAQCGTDTLTMYANSFEPDAKQSLFSLANDTLLGFQDISGSPLTATATKTYTGNACYYDLLFHAAGEKNGRSEYRIYINSTLLASFTTALSADTFELSDKFHYLYERLALKPGDQIKVQTKNGSVNDTWSKAAWHKIELLPSSCAGNNTFVEQNGYLIIEMESQATLPPLWDLKTGDGAIDSYIEYTGPNSFGSQPAGSLMTYKIFINNPGTYQFLWRTRNGFNAEATDAENDSWLRINANDFYGILSGNKIDCRGDYIKVWVHNMNNWTYNAVKGERHGANGFDIFATFSDPGEYTISIAGRSKGHIIDRMILFKPGMKSTATNLSSPESETGCTGEFKGIVNSDTIIPQKGPFPGVTHTIPGIIDATLFDIGDENVTHSDYNKGWEGGLTYNNNPRYIYAGVENVEIEDGFVGYVRDKEWISYTIANTQNGTYDIKLKVASISRSLIKVYLDTFYLGMREIPNTRGWTNFFVFKIEGVTLKDVPDNSRLKVEFLKLPTGSHTYLVSFAEIEFERTDNVAVINPLVKTVKLFPNPFNDYLTISGISPGAVLEIYDVNKRRLMQKQIGQSSKRLDLTKYSNGVYFVNIIDTDGQSQFFKVIKQ